MFDGFANVWTPVELSRRLGRRPRRIEVAGEKLVLFRDQRGDAAALSDRCRHRGASLSLGRVVDGCVECPFHGWRFSSDGACRAVPLNDLAPSHRARLGTAAFAVRERGGLVWLFTRPGSRDSVAAEPDVSTPLADPELVHWRGSTTWKVHWSRAMENSLDFAHLPFVHRHTIGLRFRRDVRDDARMSLFVAATEAGMRITSWWSGARHRQLPVELEFVRPNGMRLRLTEGGRDQWLHLWCVPLDHQRTRILMATMQRGGRYNPLRPVLNLLNHYIGREDRLVAESIEPSEVPDPHDEVHVPTDRPTLLFRRYYQRELNPRTPRDHDERELELAEDTTSRLPH